MVGRTGSVMVEVEEADDEVSVGSVLKILFSSDVPKSPNGA
jgi:hypothetical protein